MNGTPPTMATSNLRSVKRQMAEPQSFLITYPAGFRDTVAFVLAKVLNAPASHALRNRPPPRVEDHPMGFLVTEASLRWGLEWICRLPVATDIFWLPLRKARAGSLTELGESILRERFIRYAEPGEHTALIIKTHRAKVFRKSAVRQELIAQLCRHGIPVVSEGPKGYLNRQRILCYIDGWRADFGYSLTGVPHFLRSFGKAQTAGASLREDLAACLVAESLKVGGYEWRADEKLHVVVPFVGSGTLAIAALEPFTNLLSFYQTSAWLTNASPSLQQSLIHLQQKLADDQKGSGPILVSGCDIRPVEAVVNHIRSMGKVCFGERSFDVDISRIAIAEFGDRCISNSSGLILLPLNPPYGKRLNSKGEADLAYQGIFTILEHLDAKNPKARICGFVLAAETRQINRLKGFFRKMRDRLQWKWRTINQGGLQVTVFFFHRSAATTHQQPAQVGRGPGVLGGIIGTLLVAAALHVNDVKGSQQFPSEEWPGKPILTRIEGLMGVPFREDGASNEGGAYTTFTDQKIRYETPGFNCSGFVVEFMRRLTGRAIHLDQARRDRLADSGPAAKKGQDWDFGLDLIQNVSEGMPTEVVTPRSDEMKELSFDPSRGFNLHEDRTWSYLLKRIRASKLYLFSINKPALNKGYGLIHYHVGAMIRLPDGVYLYHTTEKAKTHRMNLSTMRGLAWFHDQFRPSPYHAKYIYMLEVSPKG